MRVGIDIRCLMEKKYSGVSLYTLNLLHEIFHQDKKDEYILFYNSGKPISIPEFPYPNVRIFSTNYPNKIFNLALRFFHFPPLDILMGGVDIIFFPNINFFSVSKKCKMILTIHDLSYERYQGHSTLKSRIWHSIISPKKMCERSDHIIAVSENTKNDLLDLYKIPDKKISIIHSGLDEKIHAVENKEILNFVKEKYSLPDNFILYLGNIDSRKNISGIIQAFMLDIIPRDCHLVLAGFHAQDKNHIERIIKNRNGRIHCIGYIDEEDKSAVFSLSKVFLYPSFYEGFGFPPLEAMACKVPTIVSCAGSLPEIVGDASILIDPYNVNDIAHAVRSLLYDDVLRKKIIEKGCKRAQLFQWQATAQKVIQLFSTI